MKQGFQLAGQGPQAYERYLVPAFFAPCAEQLLDVVPVAPGQRVLDVACGTGIVARLASALVGGDAQVVGVDFNEGMIEVGRAVETVGTVTWHTADAANLPLPDAAFDVVYCQQGLQFFTDRTRALREMHRVLRPGGRAAIAAWRALEHSPAFAAFVQVLQRHAGDEAAAMMRAPFALPDREEIRNLMVDVGFLGTTLRLAVVIVRFRSAEEFLHHEVVSTPLAGPVGALDRDRYQALSHDLAQILRTYTDDDGVVLPMQTWLATAHR